VTKSLRGELLAWLLLPLVAVVLFNVWTTYVGANTTASLITDRILLASARVIAEQVKDYDGVIEAFIPPSALEMFASDEPDRVIYRIIGPDGALIAGDPDSPAPPALPTGLQPLYFKGEFRAMPMRAVVLAQPIASRGKTREAMIIVAETLRGHDKLVGDLWLKALRDQVVLVAAAGLLALFGLNRGLAPLLRLRNTVVERDPSELKPIDVHSVQVELQPLTAALNDAFERVRNLIATQRRFVANAAHQLRTPLALLKTQANVGLREGDLQSKNEALAGVDTAVDALTRLANQMLALARAEQGSHSIRKSAVDFAAVVREALERLAQLALARAIDLGLDCEPALPLIFGHPTLLHELVINLVDNALRYTPLGGTVNVSLRRDHQDMVLRVEDSGPGIPLAERQRVFERFYRLLGTGVEGTGLGLAIVREIVAAHDGSITISDGKKPSDGQPVGLLVEVRLPVPGVHAPVERYSHHLIAPR
jgi:two-component system, OmpR family, sensor histidine kinase TctE